MDYQNYYEANRRHWDESADIHVKSTTGVYRVDDFKKGADILLPIEARELPDITGKRILHLQCHFGLDTLSLARRGARVTGVDFSPSAIGHARALSEETGVPGTFVECNLYDARDHVDGLFDGVFVSWGAICWLPDIPRWAEIIAEFLKPGGFFYMVEGHPAALALDEVEGRYVPSFDYFQGSEPVAFDEAHTYTGDEDVLENQRGYFWIHPLSRILNSLMAAGLAIEMFNEHDTLCWSLFPSMVDAGEGMLRLPDGVSGFPLSFSLKAVKA
ncbi:class I SAM-dependent methyltransferase [Aestuariispira insulae]|uniref:Methyltransferase family protein n=1 Tax=Aestuariispira insulae TaxID=1461337 RepID=A0A3D9HTC9_9PROT|nr:class I SAM-dependent methyltransferase [Aestuariispira insulae]RED52136.1 methyltransferase family protein [Aestuariispira insulae]